MADTLVVFINPSGSALAGENLFEFGDDDPHPDPFATPTPLQGNNFFEVSHWSFGATQTLNIGSQSTGAGAGRVTFNAFSITRLVDKVSPGLFLTECSGTPFKYVDIINRKSTGGEGQNASRTYVAWRFGLCAIHSIGWAEDESDPEDGEPLERITFEYGQLGMAYRAQKPNGQFGPYIVTGWDRVKNVKSLPVVVG